MPSSYFHDWERKVNDLQDQLEHARLSVRDAVNAQLRAERERDEAKTNARAELDEARADYQDSLDQRRKMKKWVIEQVEAAGEKCTVCYSLVERIRTTTGIEDEDEKTAKAAAGTWKKLAKRLHYQRNRARMMSNASGHLAEYRMRRIFELEAELESLRKGTP